jgi:flagellar biogenesis protein FliO
VTLLETTRLSPRQALHLIRAGGQMYLIGATDQGVTLLAEVEPAPAPLVEPAAQPAAPAFAAALVTATQGVIPTQRAGELA